MIEIMQVPMSILKLTSRDNPKLKSARNVRDGRDRTAIFVEGVRLVEECLRSPPEIDRVFIADRLVAKSRVRRIVDGLMPRGIEIVELSRSVFDSLADTGEPQGIIAIAKRPETGRRAFEKKSDSAIGSQLIVYLHAVNNPSNLGAVLRTAEAASASGVIISGGSADVFSPKSVRSSMGSAFRIPVWANADEVEVQSWASERKLVLTGADSGSGKSYIDIDWTVSRLVIFGSEAHGIPETLKRDVTDLIRIPMADKVESLNLAVSAGIILFEAKRQRDLMND